MAAIIADHRTPTDWLPWLARWTRAALRGTEQGAHTDRATWPRRTTGKV